MARPKPQTNNQSFSPTQFDLTFINQRPSSRLKSWTLIISPIKEDWVKTKVFRDVKKNQRFHLCNAEIVNEEESFSHSDLHYTVTCLTVSLSPEMEKKKEIFDFHIQ